MLYDGLSNNQESGFILKAFVKLKEYKNEIDNSKSDKGTNTLLKQ